MVKKERVSENKAQVIKEALLAYCCDGSVKKYRRFATDNEHCKELPKHALWAIANCPSYKPDEAVIRQAAEDYPRLALYYKPELLKPETLDRMAELEPSTALARAAYFITPDRLRRCALAKPFIALFYIRHLMDEGLIAACEEILAYRQAQKEAHSEYPATPEDTTP